MQATKFQKNVEPFTISECPNNFWSSQITFCKITCGDSNQSENLHCGVTKVSITYNMVHHEGVPVSSYYVIAAFASVQIIFGATVDNAPRRAMQRRHNILDGIDEANIHYNRLRPRY